MSDHSYTIGDYPDGASLDASVLHRRVVNDATLGGLTLTGVRCVHGEAGVEAVRYRFAETLDAGQIAALDALVAGHVEETLSEAKARCTQECKDWRDLKMNAPVDQGGMSVEYPAASGKLWSVGFVDQQYWDALYGAKDDLTYPVVLRTWDEQDSHSFASANDIKAIYGDVRDAVLGEIQTCDTAIAGVWAAADIAAAEAARDSYVGT